MLKINYDTLHIALPALDELDYLPATIESIRKQDYKNYVIHVCVNQPDHWWDDPEKLEICERNQKTIEYLRSHAAPNLKIHDKSSKGKGWIGKQCGIGWARKYLMDYIAKHSRPQDIIVSLDADTLMDVGYFGAIISAFNTYDNIIGISAPYYHSLNENADIDRAILRYEIYMRYYLINLYRIGSPYAFTALGSAISVPVWVYQVISGITPKSSGEDFYFLQKLRKYGKVLNWLPQKVYPAARFSNRVNFGTGPAIEKGVNGDWSSYPVYDHRLFDEIKETYNMFPRIFKRDIETPVVYFLKQQLNEDDLWGPLRKNFKSEALFIKACHDKFDGLRILQYLKHKQNRLKISDEESLVMFFKKMVGQDITAYASIFDHLSFKYSGIFELNKLRNLLFKMEEDYRKNDIPS